MFWILVPLGGKQENIFSWGKSNFGHAHNSRSLFLFLAKNPTSTPVTPSRILDPEFQLRFSFLNSKPTVASLFLCLYLNKVIIKY